MARIFHNFDLTSYNSFGITAEADRLVEWNSVSDLRGFLSKERDFCAHTWDILGMGCNTIFMGNYRGTLLHSVSKGITIISSDKESVTIRVAAGEIWDNIVERAVGSLLWGIENLSAIPSSVGAAAVQNIGAYGAEVKDVITAVEMLDLSSLTKVTYDAQFCSFGYRDSAFKHNLKGSVVITAVIMRLSKKPTPRLDYGALREEVAKRGEPTAKNIRDAVMAIRASKLPDPKITGNAGSFFKNPVVTRSEAEALKRRFPELPLYEVESDASKMKLSTGWMIDYLGWKGKNMGRAAVHDKQALVLVNLGGATGREVMALANEISRQIDQTFGVTVEPEVNIL